MSIENQPAPLINPKPASRHGQGQNELNQEEQILGESEADVNAGDPPKQNERQLNSAYRLVESLTGKKWFEAWTLDDVCLMLRNALSHPRCPTCKGSGYQGLIGAPGCMGGCEDCDGTGLALVGKREASSVLNGTEKHLAAQVSPKSASSSGSASMEGANKDL